MNNPEYCFQCKYHIVVNDRNPENYIDDDDMCIQCVLLKPIKLDSFQDITKGKPLHHIISGKVRPNNIKQIKSPVYCPLKNQTTTNGKDKL